MSCPFYVQIQSLIIIVVKCNPFIEDDNVSDKYSLIHLFDGYDADDCDELQLIKIHIGKTKDITVTNTYFPPRDTTSSHYNTVDTDIAYCKRHVTNIPDSILTGDVNAHSTLWYSHIDDHRGQLISYIIINSEHIILNNNTPTRVPNTTLQQVTSPDITTISTTLYNRTTWHTIQALNSDHLPIITTINTRTKYKLQQNRHTFTNYRKANWTEFTTDTEAAFSDIQPPPDIHTANPIFTNIILHADKHNIPKGKIHSTFSYCDMDKGIIMEIPELLSEHNVMGNYGRNH